jgi:hypothetical protein
MNKKLIFSVLLVCLLAFVAVMAFSQTSQNVRWEYTYFDSRAYLNSGAINPELNRLGQEGWELVLGDNYGCVLKRRLP